MERDTIKVTTIEVTDTERMGDIAIQALNIKREGGILDVYLLPDTNVIRVKYEVRNNNLEDVLASWGKELYTHDETILYLDIQDLKDEARNQIDKIFQEEPKENTAEDITFHFEE